MISIAVVIVIFVRILLKHARKCRWTQWALVLRISLPYFGVARFGDLQNGYYDIGVLGGARIDRYGNLNR